jgi:hypothetical protein
LRSQEQIGFTAARTACLRLARRQTVALFRETATGVLQPYQINNVGHPELEKIATNRLILPRESSEL